jgi:oligogalacturonide lyase
MYFRQIRTAALFCAAPAAFAQVGRTWPSEKKIVPDPVSGLPLTFPTSSETYHQSKIYQTHRQWTSEGKWLIFRGQRETGSQAMAVSEETGQIVQVTENGFSGMLCLSNIAMKLYKQILEIDLAKLFADVAAKSVKPAANYTRVCGTIPPAAAAPMRHLRRPIQVTLTPEPSPYLPSPFSAAS